jgi:hypothetical protein
MKVSRIDSGHYERRGQGQRAVLHISLEPENEMEKALVRMASAGQREVYCSMAGGTMSISVTMPRGK